MLLTKRAQLHPNIVFGLGKAIVGSTKDHLVSKARGARQLIIHCCDEGFS
jgi:hypothetical protein